jgi:dTDP-4-dehydrorhamnose reductase
VTVLVVGGSGYLGGEVCRQALAAGEWVVGTYASESGPAAGVTWTSLDLRDGPGVHETVRRLRPRVVVNAAYARDDWAVTATGAAHVAAAAAQVGARLVHVSSDAVHGGRETSYVDDEPPTPVYPYGAAKAAAETAVAALHPAAAIVRTSLIVGDAASHQEQLARAGLAGRAVLLSDDVRTPVAVTDLAAALLELAAGDRAGLLNVAGPEAVTRVAYALMVSRRYGLDASALRQATVAESGLRRPARVVLDVSRAQALLRTRLRPVSEVYRAGHPAP